MYIIMLSEQKNKATTLLNRYQIMCTDFTIVAGHIRCSTANPAYG